MEALSIYSSLKNLEKMVADEQKRHLIEGGIAIYAFFVSRKKEGDEYYYRSSNYTAIENELQIIKNGLDATCKKLESMNVDDRINEILDVLHKSPLKGYLNEKQHPRRRPFAFVSRMLPDGVKENDIAKIGKLVQDAVKLTYQKNTEFLQKSLRMGRHDDVTKTEYVAITDALREYYESIKDSIKAAKPDSA